MTYTELVAAIESRTQRNHYATADVNTFIQNAEQTNIQYGAVT
jgi:hypothetical protein